MARFLQFFNGFRMPSVGLGTYSLVGDLCKETVDRALGFGYRHIDTAHAYRNEKEIGEVLTLTQKHGKIKRKDLFLTSKIPSVYLAPMDVNLCVEESLESLKVKYLDLVLIHNPWGLRNRGDGNLKPMNEHGQLEFVHHDLTETWKALEYLVDIGSIRSIGLSNFNVPQIENLLSKSKIKPANLQLEYHAYQQQGKLKSFCDHHISLSAYSPLGSPDRPGHHRLDEHPVLLDDPIINDTAQKYKKTPAQILLRWILQTGVAVIPKSQNYNRLKENLDLFDFNISPSDMMNIKNIDRGVKYFHFQPFKGHPEFHEQEKF